MFTGLKFHETTRLYIWMMGTHYLDVRFVGCVFFLSGGVASFLGKGGFCLPILCEELLVGHGCREVVFGVVDRNVVF